MGMMKKMQDEMAKVQASLAEKTITQEAGGGMVKATANGNRQVVSLEIDPSVLNSEEKEILEDLIIAAVNKAVEAAGKMANDEMAKVTKNFIPPGLNIPGLF